MLDLSLLTVLLGAIMVGSSVMYRSINFVVSRLVGVRRSYAHSKEYLRIDTSGMSIGVRLLRPGLAILALGSLGVAICVALGVE
jgi:hypothetical protein